jgi:hypothetical protein
MRRDLTSLPERLLGAALTLLAAALAVYTASRVLLAVIWFIVGCAAAGLTAGVAWQIWQRNRSGW